MSKTPEEYFQEQNFSLPGKSGFGTEGQGGFSAAELTFIRKYMGVDAPETLRRMGIRQEPEPVEILAALDEPPLAVPSFLASVVDDQAALGPEQAAPPAPGPSPAVAEPAAAGPLEAAGAGAPDRPAPETGSGSAPAEAAASGAPTSGPAAVRLEPVDVPPDAGPLEGPAQAEGPAAAASEIAPEILPEAPAAPKPAPASADLAVADLAVADLAVADLAAAEPAAADLAAQASGQAADKAFGQAGEAHEAGRETEVAQPAASDTAEEAVQEPAGPEAAEQEPASIAEIYEGMDIEEALDHFLRHEAELQMVAFYLGDQEFTVPTVIVQEVIRYSEPAKLPVSPPFVAGVINLRGKVTPLVHLRDILEVNQARKSEDRFIIICRFRGLQVGLIIERVHTMYRVPQSDIDWGIEQHLGINVDYICGLLKMNDHLLGIVSVDRIVTSILQDL